MRRERSARVGLDAPGLPFDGFPVFRFSPRDATGEWCVAPLVDFRAPSRPRTSLLPAAPARVPIGSRRPRPALGSHRPACASQSHHPSTAAFLSVPCSTAHEVEGIRRSPRALALARRSVAGAPGDRAYARLWNLGDGLTAAHEIDGGCQPPPGARSQRFYALSGPSVRRVASPGPPLTEASSAIRRTCAARIPHRPAGFLSPRQRS